MTAQKKRGKGLRVRAEATLKANGPSKPTETMSLEATQQLVHQLRVHQIELEMQNDELRRTQTELEATRARYFDLYDLAPVGYCTLDAKGGIIEANLTAASLLGLDRRSLLGQSIHLFIAKEDHDPYYLRSRSLMENTEPQSFDLRMVRKDGTPFCAHLTARTGEDDAGASVLRVVLSDETARQSAEAALESSLHEKEALLKEVHHRVKNNLQVIISLLRLENARTREPGARRVLQDMQGRVISMALLHETLYRSGHFGRVDLSSYLEELARQLFRAHQMTAGRAELVLDLGPALVQIDQAIPCGLILNELMTNSLKHAFTKGRGGELRVRLSLDVGGALQLQVSDNGAGLPADFETIRGSSLGLQLVADLVRQLGGRLDIGPAPSATFTVAFTPTPTHPTDPTRRPSQEPPRS